MLAKERTEETDSEDEPPKKYLEVVEVPLHNEIHLELNRIFVEELYKVVSETNQNEEKSVTEYNAANINRTPKPIQYLPIDSISHYDLFEPITDSSPFPENSYEGLGAADFQALRVRDQWGNMFVGFRKFTKNQIVGSSWKVKLMLTDNEYDLFEDNLFALPEKFDAFLYKDHLFVINQGSFEDIFNYFSDYEESTQNVLDGLEESEITIHNDDFFEEAVSGDRYALRKMAVVEQRGLYSQLSKEKVEKEIEEYDLNVETAEKDGEWGLILPSKGDKKDLIRLLNDENLISESTELRYHAPGARPVND